MSTPWTPLITHGHGALCFYTHINSLAPGKSEWNFRYVTFKRLIVIDGWCILCETPLIWMSLDFTDDQSMLVQVMAWCRQATSHYLNQCWPRSLSPYGVTRPEWVNSTCLKSVYPSKLLQIHQQEELYTVKPVCNDHLYNKIYYLLFIQQCVLMKTEGTNLLLLTISAFWSPSRWPLAT